MLVNESNLISAGPTSPKWVRRHKLVQGKVKFRFLVHMEFFQIYGDETIYGCKFCLKYLSRRGNLCRRESS